MMELKPCPFCGGEARVQSFYKDHYVYCRKCNASTMKYYPAKEEAIEAWNMRAPEQEVSMALYDQEEIHHNCTVQILSNSVTVDVSIGWWQEDKGNVEMYLEE